MGDVRWRQRFGNFQRAFETPQAAADLAKTRELTDLEKQGLIQGFEFTHELAWNVLKDFLTNQGISGLIGSKDATREAFKNGLIQDGDAWMKMIESRNLTSHTYNLAIAEEVVADILTRYVAQFTAFHANFLARSEQVGPQT